ncbi:MAG: tetraacyldisaccharide 4'-kinase [Rhodanobacteraceae bacterium]
MSRLALRLQRIWYDREPVPFWLAALVPVYRLLRWMHLSLYRWGLRKADRINVPLVVVGNLTAGGSGKTPLVIALIEALRARGFRPGIVSRGYGGSQRAATVLDDAPDPLRYGDEASLMRRRTGALVAVGRDRTHAAALLVQRGANVVIADDGLQNPALARDIEICVIDGQRRFGNELLLPAGPLREPLARLARVDFRVCNGARAESGEVAMRLVGAMAVSVAGVPAARPLGSFSGKRVHAIAAIGNPGRFFTGLQVRGIDVIPHPFADHHVFSAGDLAFGDGLPVMMTEKDAIKCVDFAGENIWCVPVSAELPPEFIDDLIARLRKRDAAPPVAAKN